MARCVQESEGENGGKKVAGGFKRLMKFVVFPAVLTSRALDAPHLPDVPKIAPEMAFAIVALPQGKSTSCLPIFALS